MQITAQQLKEIISNFGLLSEQDLEDIQKYASQAEVGLLDALIDKGILSDEQVGQIVANYFNIPFVTLSKVQTPPELLHVIPEKFAKNNKIVIFEKNEEGIKVATANPENTQILNIISWKTGGSKVIPYLATERDIFNTFVRYKKDLQFALDDLMRSAGDTNEVSKEDAPISRIVETLFLYAYQNRSSDVHIEPQETYLLVRFRIDGVLQDVAKLPTVLHERILTRIKVLARLRTDEHLTPQDGKIRMMIDEEKQEIDIRISIIPIVNGEKAVCRILSSKFQQFSLQELGINQKYLKKVMSAIRKPWGMILSTGPTGSGKTSTIYAILRILNIREKNITTIEDPVEIRMKNVNQIQVNTKTGLTFASGLRSILRQDPNIILVGEIRDSETAGIAVNAALTGHLVLSTLHTNDASTTLPRLVDMKVEPFLVASTVNIIIAQRLVRKICPLCREAYEIPRHDISKHVPEEIITDKFGNENMLKIYKGKGCQKCRFTGYKGRIGLFEILEVTPEMRKLINQKIDADILKKQATKEGMSTMIEDGIDKVARGLTALEEVLRVTKIEDV